MSKKLFSLLLLLLFVISGAWYFFFKEYDFTISFKTKVAPGIAYNKINSWNYQELETLKTNKTALFKDFEQRVEFATSTYLLHWTFSAENDSVTKVMAGVNNTEGSFQNRLILLFGKAVFKEKIEKEILRMMETISADSELYRVSIEGKTISPDSFCACISKESETDKKAYKMMATIDQLSEFVMRNNLETNGRPRVQVNHWDPEKNTINFDFCFPVKKPGRNLEDPVVFFREIAPFPALKATYHGNYMFSHYAWLELLNHARIHGIEASNSPLEIFHNNPEMGGNSLNWKAEIYLSLQQ